MAASIGVVRRGESLESKSVQPGILLSVGRDESAKRWFYIRPGMGCAGTVSLLAWTTAAEVASGNLIDIGPRRGAGATGVDKQ